MKYLKSTFIISMVCTIYCDRGRIETLLVFKYGCVYFEIHIQEIVSLVVGRTSSTILSKQRFLPILAPEMCNWLTLVILKLVGIPKYTTQHAAQ